MGKTTNYNLHLYTPTENFKITSETDSLNANMKIIDEVLKNSVQKESTEIKINLLDIPYNWIDWTVLQSNGTITSIIREMTTGYIEVESEDEIAIKENEQYKSFSFIEFEKMGEENYRIEKDLSINNGTAEHKVGSGVTHIRISTQFSNNIKVLKNKEEISVSWSIDKRLLEGGKTEAILKYCTSNDYIPLKSSLTFTGKNRCISLYDQNYNHLKFIKNNNYDEINIDTNYLAEEGYPPIKYIRVSYVNDNTECSIVENKEMFQIEENVLLNNNQLNQIVEAINTTHDYKNMLTNKTWYIFGDSFSAGTGTENFSEGLYSDKPQAYPYFIGNRCGMKIYNFAKDGKTMASVSSSSGGCCVDEINDNFEDHLNNPPDYITLFFGANDRHNDVEIGNIDDTTYDITTYCGAWNTVLSTIITTYPTTHIGIIIANCNGTSDPNYADFSEYVEATKNIAKRWGIPYLDLAEGEQVPLLFRTLKSDTVCEEAINARTNAFMIPSTDPAGYHPNEACHEYESYFIENWLMSI